MNTLSALKKEHAQLAKKLERVAAAIAALGGRRKKTRRMSAAARRKISVAQRKNWAKRREDKEQRYFPHLEQRLKMSGELHLEPSTLKGSRDIWKFHGQNSEIASVRVRDFTTVHAQS